MEISTFGIGSQIEHPQWGKGVIVDIASETYNIWFKSQSGTRLVSKEYKELQLIKASEGGEAYSQQITLADIEFALEKVLDQRMNEFQIVPMALKWNKGTMILKPGDDSLQPKEVPIDVFFHKIIMVRDRLRLIEQKINSHKVMTDEEKVELQQYVSGVYGSLTTFNVLFKETHHQFKGTGKG